MPDIPIAPLQGRHALVTGAALTLLGRRRETLQALADELPRDTPRCVVVADVADPTAVAAAMAEARAALGPLHILVNNAGQKGYAYVSAYSAAKHGVIGLTRSLALELATRGVTVNAVCPGYTETDILRESVARVVAKTGRSEQRARAGFAGANPQQRIVQPAEVADALRWLCSAGAAAITGQSISVSGGEVT